MKNETRQCQNCKQDFVIDTDDFNFYEKIKVPPPTFCHECRMIRRFNYRNEQGLYRRPDAHTGKEIFSGFSPKANVLTLENSKWFGSEWDCLESGVDYDFSKPFFEQMRALLSRAPLPSRSVYNLVNSDYCNEASELKNCYLSFNIDYAENSAYLRKVNHIKDSFDLFEGTEDEVCYETVMVDKSYRTLYSVDCESCVDVWFSKGLRGCTNCFGCVNLTKKSNYFFNEPCTKEEYEKKVAEFNLGSHAQIQEIKKAVQEFWLRFPVKFNHTLRTLNSTGERVYDSKNAKDCYTVRGAENVRYCQDIQSKTANSYDYSVWGAGADNIYECMTCGIGCYNLKFCFNCWDEVRDLEYSIYCMSSHDLFGCVGLYKKEYCIFNKQYTKEDYFILRDKIIAHMNEMPYTDKVGRVYRYGEFFPFELSPIAYNECIAHDFFPLTAETAALKGYTWRDQDLREFQTTIKSQDLPDDISDVSDEITKEIIECDTCKRAYRIIPIELQFYKKLNIPLPHSCHNCRFTKRFSFMNPPKLSHRSCMCEQGRASTDSARHDPAGSHLHSGKCSNEFETSYAPERPEIVYCEECYQKDVM